MASIVVGGSQFESMLCHCKIWWRAIPSTKPPRPMPSRIPAVAAFLRWSGVCIRTSLALLQLPMLLINGADLYHTLCPEATHKNPHALFFHEPPYIPCHASLTPAGLLPIMPVGGHRSQGA